jgi:hypothetical protein
MGGRRERNMASYIFNLRIKGLEKLMGFSYGD